MNVKNAHHQIAVEKEKMQPSKIRKKENATANKNNRPRFVQLPRARLVMLPSNLRLYPERLGVSS